MYEGLLYWEISKHFCGCQFIQQCLQCWKSTTTISYNSRSKPLLYTTLLLHNIDCLLVYFKCSFKAVYLLCWSLKIICSMFYSCNLLFIGVSTEHSVHQMFVLISSLFQHQEVFLPFLLCHTTLWFTINCFFLSLWCRLRCRHSSLKFSRSLSGNSSFLLRYAALRLCRRIWCLMGSRCRSVLYSIINSVMDLVSTAWLVHSVNLKKIVAHKPAYSLCYNFVP